MYFFYLNVLLQPLAETPLDIVKITQSADDIFLGRMDISTISVSLIPMVRRRVIFFRGGIRIDGIFQVEDLDFLMVVLKIFDKLIHLYVDGCACAIADMEGLSINHDR